MSSSYLLILIPSALIFCLSMTETGKVPFSSRWYFLFNRSLYLCFNLVFPLWISSVLLRSLLRVSILCLILHFQNGSLVFLSFPFFNIPILSVVTYAAAYIKEFSSVMFWVSIFLAASFTFPTSAQLSALLCHMISMMVILLFLLEASLLVSCLGEQGALGWSLLVVLDQGVQRDPLLLEFCFGPFVLPGYRVFFLYLMHLSHCG